MSDEMERITLLLRRLVVRKEAREPWRRFVASMSEGDDDVSGGQQTVVRDVYGAEFFIRYVDAQEKVSERDIQINSLAYFGDDLGVNAFCFSRDRPRQFLASRIQYMEDLQTGEVIPDAHAWLQELSSRSPTAEALERAAPGLQILACLAWCDGHLSEAEWTVMLEYVDSCAPSLDLNWDVIERFVHCVRPSLAAYDKAVNRLKFQGWDQSRRIASAGRRLVLADGALSAEEVDLMGRLEEFLT